MKSNQKTNWKKFKTHIALQSNMFFYQTKNSFIEGEKSIDRLVIEKFIHKKKTNWIRLLFKCLYNRHMGENDCNL